MNNKILFRITEDALIVANTGKPFTRKGIISICHMHLSEKSGKPVDECDEKNLIQSITKKRLGVYSSDANQIIEDVEKEKATSKDYKGRFLLEFLQNADDAAVINDPSTSEGNSKLSIGEKGIGFKSVIDYSKGIEIYSDRSEKYHFEFSKEKTEKLLIENRLINPGDEVPLTRIPHVSKPSKECTELAKVYDTVIRLIIKSDDKRDEIIDDLKNLDPSLLFFSQALTEIEIEVDDDEGFYRHFSIDRETYGFKKDEVDFVLSRKCSKEESSKTQKWHRWSRAWESKPDALGVIKQMSVAICLPISAESGKAEPLEKSNYLFVFFPTNQHLSGVRAHVHASYDLSSNREHLLKDQSECKFILKKICELSKEIIEEVPARTALQVFGNMDYDNNMKCSKGVKHIDLFNNSVARAIREVAFVPVLGGGARVKVEEARLWHYEKYKNLEKVIEKSALRKENLVHSDIIQDDECCEILKNNRALNCPSEYKYMELLQNCKNSTIAQCKNALKLSNSILKNIKYPEEIGKELKDSMRQVPLWWVQSKRARALGPLKGGELPLLLDKPDDGWPSFLKFDCVDPDFRKFFMEEDDEFEFACKDEKYIWPLKPDSYFEHILLPFLEKTKKPPKWWRKQGYQIIKTAYMWWELAEKTELDDARGKAEQFIRMPTDKGWLPAMDCYAGESWGGAKIEGLIKGKSDRGVVIPFNEWDIEEIKKQDLICDFLKWLDVSWCFKVNFEGKIEYLSSMLKYCKPSDILNGIFAIYKNHSDRFPPALSIQLKNTCWVPCVPSIFDTDKFKEPRLIYMPGLKIEKIKPTVDQGDIKNDRWNSIYDMLGELGVGTKFSISESVLINTVDSICKKIESLSPEDKAKKLLWNRTPNEASGEYAEIINALYIKYFEQSGTLDNDMPIPYLYVKEEIEFIGFSEEDVYWADEPYFDDLNVRKEVIKKKKCFFMFLEDHKVHKSKLRPLSSELKMKPEYGVVDESGSKDLKDRYEERIMFIEKAIEKTIPEFIIRDDFKIIANKGLKLTASHEKYSDIKPNIAFYWDEGNKCLHINVDKSDVTRWSTLASGLAEIMGNKEYKSHIENFLLTEHDAECIYRLRHDYKLTEDALKEIASLSDEENTGDTEGSYDAEGVENTENSEDAEGTSAMADESESVPRESRAPVPQPWNPDRSRDNRNISRSSSTPNRDDSNTSSGRRSNGGGGESEQHKELKLRVMANPEILDLTEQFETHEERSFVKNGHKIDVLFTSDEEWVVVEVKPETADSEEILRGLYQCVAYRALATAHISLLSEKSANVRSILVLGDDLPADLKVTAEIFEVKVRVIKLD